ncbi:hypothetical protein, partial [Klebsiella pneumoniae]|uniref:hypothetical protein n=1 Tax=Klebsiella pneumoniae TaxID=573 RepID=UPI001953E678
HRRRRHACQAEAQDMAPAMRMPGARAFAGESIATQLDALLDATASAYGTVGYSVAVLRRGRLVHLRHAGLADR